MADETIQFSIKNENESSASGDCADKKPQGGSSYGH